MTESHTPADTILHFPDRRSVGRLEVWEAEDGTWQPLAEARWRVVVPGQRPAALWIDHDVTDADLAFLASVPPNVLDALMIATPSVGDATFAMVEHLSSLRVLSIPGTGITDAGLESLAPLRCLVALNLSGCAVSSDGMSSLHSPPLRTLMLRGTQVDDAVVDHLAQLPELRYLHLSNTAVTDAGLATLLAIPTLELVALNGSLVSPDGIARMWVERPDIALVAR